MKLRVLIFAAVLLVTIPSFVSAQPSPPHTFAGRAYIDGQLAPEGTLIRAFVGSQLADETKADCGGNYSLAVGMTEPGDDTGGAITFEVNGHAATETAFWELGGVHLLNLNAVSAPKPITEVFAGLISDGSLSRVWHHDNLTKEWNFFDPSPVYENFNTLTEVAVGDVLIVDLSKQGIFLGQTLHAGLNFISVR